MDLFTLKKIIGVMLMPINLILLLMIFGLLFQRSNHVKSTVCFVSATILLLLSSLAPVSDRLMQPIEANYEAFSRSSKPVDYIVVLGCGHVNDDMLPATSQLNVCSLQRMAEALRIYQMHPEAMILTSGAAFSQPKSNAETVKQALVDLGVEPHKVIVEVFPKDTEEEAQLIAPRVRGTNVVLITNADHMPRSVTYFERQGVTVHPAPAGNWVRGMHQPKAWGYYVPNAKELQQTTNAWYETLGRIVQWFKGLV
ncbi:ElyC/SanA/YdcF family protein [Thalassotalea fusca]